MIPKVGRDYNTSLLCINYVFKLDDISRQSSVFPGKNYCRKDTSAWSRSVWGSNRMLKWFVPCTAISAAL